MTHEAPRCDILFAGCYVPPEWIAAHALRPRRIAPPVTHDRWTRALPEEGMCPVARAMGAEALRRAMGGGMTHRGDRGERRGEGKQADVARSSPRSLPSPRCDAVLEPLPDASAHRPVALVLTTLCDQQRRLPDVLDRPDAPPVFLLNVPARWGAGPLLDLYVRELERLGRWLVGLGGTAPSRDTLVRTIRDFAARRRQVLDLRERLSARALHEALIDVASGGSGGARGGEVACGASNACDGGLLTPVVRERAERFRGSVMAASQPPHSKGIACACRRSEASSPDRPSFPASLASPASPPVREGIPVALVGGELTRGDLDVLDAIEREGLRIVLDATDGGEGGLPAVIAEGEPPLNPASSQLAAEPLRALARAYLNLPHPARRGNEAWYAALKTTLAARGARAVLFRRVPWCDLWNAEAHRLRAELSIPVLELDFASAGVTAGRTLTRVRALVESLT